MGRFILQKNMQISWKQKGVQVVWLGDYSLIQLTEKLLRCKMEEFLLHIEGQGIEIEVLYEEQLIISIEQLLLFRIEANYE